jgi:hypothetical protein
MFWNKDKIFQGWPKTTCHPDKREVKISADYLTPEGAKLRDFLTNLLTLGSLIAFVMYKKEFSFGWSHFGTLVAGLFIAHFLIFPFVLKARIWIIVAEDHVKIRNLFSCWRTYERGHEGYGFTQESHQKRFDEPMPIGKPRKSYYQDAYQISLNHYQGFVILPGIYGWEKSQQLFNRIMGVELWMCDVMPRVWGTRDSFESDDESKERGFLMNFVKKVSAVLFFLYGFIGCAFLIGLLFVCIPLGVGFLFGTAAEDAVYQFFKSFPDWVFGFGFLGIVFLCIYVGVQEARNLNKKLFSKKKAPQEKADVQEVFIAVEVNDLEERKKAPTGVGRLFIKTFSFVLAPVAVFILGVVFFKLFGITEQDVTQAIASIPESFQPVAFIFIGLSLGYFTKVVAKSLSKTMEILSTVIRTMA